MNTKSSPVPECPTAGDYLIASKACVVSNLQHFLKMGKLLQCIGNLVHGLQRERGASNLFLGSGGEWFSREREAMATESDQLKKAFGDALSDIHQELTQNPVSSRLLNQIASALHGLEGLDRLRGDVVAQSISAADATEEYSGLIHNLIAVVFEAADTAVDPGIAGLLVAMVHLMNGKELCGQERAVGSAGFSSGHVDHALSQRMAHLIEAQERCFEVFSSFADAGSLTLWQQIRAMDREQDIERLRQHALSVGPYKELDTTLADQWFHLMTARIDDLKRVEESVEGCFHSRCIERYAEARNSLAHQESLIASLNSRHDAPHQPILVLCDSGPDGGNVDAFSSSGVSQRFGRSIFDLVQEQSRRLQTMTDELQSAKEALEDRKTQEKAVLLLMEHRQISNDDAHRVLRKLAMDQGRKLPEVARALISMADVLK